MRLSVAELVTRARRLADGGGRRTLGITGTPGAGKSTVCAALAGELGDAAALVPMDGFHYANAELVRLDRRDRKGAPDTFDVDGYAALLRRLRNQTEPVVYAPRFDRRLEESIGSAVPVGRETPLILTEGNYLLLTEHGWDAVGDLLDEVWYFDIPAEERLRRLLARRESYGHPPDESAAWVRSVDLPNAELIEAGRHRADLIVELTDAEDDGANPPGATAPEATAPEATPPEATHSYLATGTRSLGTEGEHDRPSPSR